MELLISTLGFAFRSIDGRQNAPKYWNVYIYLGLLTILGGYVYLEYVTALQALGIYAVVLTYILSGYKSLTLPWVSYQITRLALKARIELAQKYYDKYRGYDVSYLFRCNQYEHKDSLKNLTKAYEQNNGFHTWHMSYRYVIAGCMICAILGTWGVPYLIACSAAGLLFPLRVRYWNTEASARLTEGILGAVIIGGWTWLV